MIAAINRLYRKVFCRGGHGVHSPFVFDLLTTVIEERCSYYCYDSLSPVRAQLRQNLSKIEYRECEYVVNEYLKKKCFSESEDKLLFRLANRFKPRIIYMVGSDLGLAPLYLTAYSKSACCTVIEPEADVAAVARKFAGKYSTSVDIHSSGKLYLQNDCSIDLFVWGKSSLAASGITGDYDSAGNGSISSCEAFSYKAFDEAVQYMNDEGLMVISCINVSRESRATWKKICAHPRVTVTLEMYSLGLVFFNPKLHRKTYKSLVM